MAGIELKENAVISGPFWSEPIKVDKVEEVADYIRIVGSTLHSHSHIDHLLKREEVDQIKILEAVIDFSALPENTFFVIEATRFRYASLFDPLLAMNVSKIEPLPFQIEAVYGYVLKQPRIRFLIADDPGAGKTIMAGLVIKEMKLR